LAYNGTIAYVAFAKPFPAGLWLGQEAHFNYGKIIFSRACSEPNPEYPRWDRHRIEDVVWELLMNGYLDCEDTAKYHYLAWKRLAQEEFGFLFEEKHNERLKGVSRMASLEIVLEVGGVTGFSMEEKEALATKKNNYYLEYISQIDRSEILPGILEFLGSLKGRGCQTALGSASKSGRMILEKLGIDSLFDVIVDGNLVTRPKPDPQVFTTAADLMQVPYGACIVVEDAAAGVEAAKKGGMMCIGVGSPKLLGAADLVVGSTKELPEVDLEKLEATC
jgi:beta-phosphoglucomutase